MACGPNPWGSPGSSDRYYPLAAVISSSSAFTRR